MKVAQINPKNGTYTAMPSTTYQDEGKIVNPETLVFKRAVKDADQAYSICKSLLQANRDRQEKERLIMQKYNDAQPWDAAKLQAAGEGWRHNRSTGFMSTMLARVLPAYTQTISSARVLTSSKLNSNTPDADQKNEDFRVVTTRTARQWDGFSPFCNQVALENVLFGAAANCWTDQWDWKPLFARTDDAIFPDGCPQQAKDCPLWMLRQRFLIHELADKLADPELASQAGWNVDNVVKAINAAQPDAGGTKTQDDYRRFEDLIRESSVGTSYQAGVKQVNAYHLFAQEANGMVSHYIVNGDTGAELFTHYDRFPGMDSCLTLYSVEIGNGKLYGSKGAGRRLYNTHVGIEQSRNLIADNLYLSGLVLMKASQQGKQAAAITVQHPICIVGDRYEVLEQKFSVDVEAFFALDRHLTQIAEMQIGAFMPGQLLDSTGEKRTASEVNYVASIEQQIKEGYLRRFFGQFQQCFWEMQKRMYSVDNITKALQIFNLKQQNQGKEFMDERLAGDMGKILSAMGEEQNGNIVLIPTMSDAVKAALELLEKGLNAKEIYELAQCPAWEAEVDLSSQNAAAIDMVAGRYIGDASIDQMKLKKRDISAKLGATIADELLIPAEDNTLQAEAVRMQLLEFDALMQGEAIPVSPRDVDEIHLQVIQQKAQELIGAMRPDAITKDSLLAARAILAHADEHVNGFLMKGGKQEQLGEAMGFLKQAHALIDTMPMPPDPALLTPPAGAEYAGMPAPPITDRSQPAATAALVNSENAPTGSQPLTADGSVALPLSKGPINLNPPITSV